MTMRILRATLVCFGLLAAAELCPGHGQGVGYRVIVHPDNPVSELTVAEVSKLFLKKTKRWDSGEPVIPIDLAKDSPVRESFSMEVHGRSAAAVVTYWQRKVFSGRATEPAIAGSMEEAVALVKESPGAIAYVSMDVDIGTARVVTIVEPQ